MSAFVRRFVNLIAVARAFLPREHPEYAVQHRDPVVDDAAVARRAAAGNFQRLVISDEPGKCAKCGMKLLATAARRSPTPVPCTPK
jgi:Heavy metal binding domain